MQNGQPSTTIMVTNRNEMQRKQYPFGFKAIQKQTNKKTKEINKTNTYLSFNDVKSKAKQKKTKTKNKRKQTLI